jgi:tyrosine-protein kinase Etk/Wzc
MQRSFIVNKEYSPQLVRAIIYRYWYWLFLSIVVSLILAFFYLRYSKFVYESTIIIQLENKDQGKEIINLENINAKSNISSEIQLLSSQFLFEKAIERLNMNVSFFNKGTVLTEEIYRSSPFNAQPFNLKDSSLCGTPIFVAFDKNVIQISYHHQGKQFSDKVKFNDTLFNQHFDIIFKSTSAFEKIDRDGKYYFIFNEKTSLSNRLISGLKVVPLDVSAKSIVITHQSNNPAMSHDIVKSLVETFFDYDDEIKKHSSDNILKFIDNQLDSLSMELKNSKDSLTKFQRSSNLSDPEEIGKNINTNINQIQDRLYEIDQELNVLKLVSNKIKNEPNRLEIYRLLPEMLGKSFESSLTKEIQELHVLLEKKEDLLFDVTGESAEIKGINSKIQQKAAFIRQIINTIQNRLTENIAAINSKLKSLEGEYFQLPEKKMEYNRLKSLQDLNEKYFSILTEKKVLYAISNAGYTSANRVLSKASLSATPISPNKKIIYGIFLFFSMLFGFFVLVMKYLTFNEINNLEDLKRLLPEKANILGGVPAIKGATKYSQLIVNDSPKSMLSEALRSIRANMSFINKDAKVIAISSSISGEGKTFVALNLAGIIAMSGKKTILIDLDLRKPKVHLGLNSENVNGVSNLVIGEVELEDCINQTQIPELDFHNGRANSSKSFRINFKHSDFNKY